LQVICIINPGFDEPLHVRHLPDRDVTAASVSVEAGVRPVTAAVTWRVVSGRYVVPKDSSIR
jgi:hypothetical protein